MNAGPVHPRRLLRCAVLGVMLAAVAGPARAAKGDKPEKPDKVDKVDKIPKSERTDRNGGSASNGSSRSPSSSTNGPPSGSRSPSTSSSSARSSSPPAATPSSPAASQFEPYRVIVDRNIFNPNRTPRTRSADDQPAVKVDQIALVGTLESEEGRVAFFDSGDPQYQKILRVGESVAGFTVKKIEPSGVELAAAEKTLPLRVNQQLRRVAGGDWRVTGRDPLRAEPARPGEPPGPAAPQVPANASDVLRRLMEQRQKQLKQ